MTTLDGNAYPVIWIILSAIQLNMHWLAFIMSDAMFLTFCELLRGWLEFGSVLLHAYLDPWIATTPERDKPSTNPRIRLMEMSGISASPII